MRTAFSPEGKATREADLERMRAKFRRPKRAQQKPVVKERATRQAAIMQNPEILKPRISLLSNRVEIKPGFRGLIDTFQRQPKEDRRWKVS